IYKTDSDRCSASYPDRLNSLRETRTRNPRLRGRFMQFVESLRQIVARVASNSRAPLVRAVVLTLVPLLLQATGADVVFAQDAGADQQQIGSINDYVEGDSGSYYEPEIGVEIVNGSARLSSGEHLLGAKVIHVDPDGLAAKAGLGEERAVGRSVLTAVL